MQTRDLFAKCVGKTFTIVGIDYVTGLPHPLFQLDVGEINGEEPYLETIWIEPEFVEPVD